MTETAEGTEASKKGVDQETPVPAKTSPWATEPMELMEAMEAVEVTGVAAATEVLPM
ncbi:hypothetical protein ACIA8I_36555 [Streptomyces rishiriensis]|uniref:hypothetical protein n=1 Tax=Streptomyces rishiriensis TaxID=68264 RepID=UPI0037BB23B0